MDRARWTIAPYFVVATANYYRDKLGFRYDRFWGDPPSHSIDDDAPPPCFGQDIEGLGASCWASRQSLVANSE